MLSEKYKTVDIQKYSHNIKWKQLDIIDNIKENNVFIDLGAIYIQNCIKYMKEEKSKINYIYSFKHNVFMEEIINRSINDIEEIKSFLPKTITIIGKSNHIEPIKPDIKLAKFLNFECIELVYKSINIYLKLYGGFLEFQTKISGSISLIYPDTNNLNDSSIYLCSIANDNDVIFSYDAIILALGKTRIYKFYEGILYVKTRDELRRHLKIPTDSNMIYSCILLGTRFAKCKKHITPKNIMSIQNKKTAVIEMLTEHNQLDFLKYIEKQIELEVI